jgi:hypothetical protein
MKVNRKKAPQKKVLEITRTGKWGSVVYLHSLECGHLEERKRPAKTEFVACGKCVMAEDFGKRTVNLVRTGVGYESITEMDLTPDPIELIFSSSERNIARIKDGVSSFLGVDPEDVSVFIEDDENMLVTGGSVFLSATDLVRIAKIGNPKFASTEEG